MKKIGKAIIKYFWNWLIWIDQGINVLFAGDPDETVSSRVGKNVHWRGRRGLWKWLADFLNWIDPGHTREYIEEDEGKDGVLE